MKHLHRPVKWISILVLVMLVMTSFAGTGILTPAKAQACVKEGLTPGWWKNHTNYWGNHWSPNAPLGQMFTGASAYNLQNRTLLQALNFPEHRARNLQLAAENLLRAAVAAYLNAVSPYVITYYKSATWIRTNVNQALLSRDRDTMLKLAANLDAWNNFGVPDLKARIHQIYRH
jgi:hypothetical protein